MEELIERLNKIPNAYFEFIDSVVDYADEKDAHYDLIMSYLKNNSSATPSDVIRLISTQPDFYDDESLIEPDALVG